SPAAPDVSRHRRKQQCLKLLTSERSASILFNSRLCNIRLPRRQWSCPPLSDVPGSGRLSCVAYPESRQEAHMKLAHSAHHGPEQSLYVLLTDLFYLLDDTDRQFFGEYGLSARQFWALHHLGEAEGLSMIDLSRLLFTDKSNITAIADRLEGAELIQRSPGPHDRRVTMLRLTAKGRQLHDEVFVAHQER